eukprot:scaffold8163_cov258-Pinguiococcus_pyrenoidosus.AAC.5
MTFRLPQTVASWDRRSFCRCRGVDPCSNEGKWRWTPGPFADTIGIRRISRSVLSTLLKWPDATADSSTALSTPLVRCERLAEALWDRRSALRRVETAIPSRR